ncbi:methyl-accepting chemotaxis protein [Azohydromonas australica]|uniref:methyl-accepting chemotaxis protein n=1 Tax=Azohydromonas australica TaxID=364039 RepID=UPI000426D07D|nr:methyl-accepting chemotaxis protein [Azohydromonas australica]
MESLNRWRIGPRLGTGFGLVLALFCAMAAVALVEISTLAGISGYYAENLVPSFETEHQIAMALSAMRRFESQHIMVNTPAEMDDMEQRVGEQQKVAAQALEHYEKALLSDDEDRRLLGAVRAAVAAYYTQWEQIRSVSRSTVENPAALEKAQKMLFGPSREAYHNLDVALQQWWAHNTQLAVQQKDMAAATERQGRAVLLGCAVLALALGSAAALLITRSITKPLTRAVETAEAVADGDLSTRVEVQGNDEAARLLQALARMNQRLSELVRQVRSGSDSIATGSREVAAGSTDLSQRTEKQAASLEETAASMEQLNVTVKHNADTAQQASQMASAASEAARKGGGVVSQVVSTMEEISASSRKIEDIIGVIDGIAFQTNILALNAAVEAARAGEQGRGFAVVAGEVRNLAQRSAGAAREIKTLIADSVSKVQTGSELVGDAGATMQDLVRQVQRVSDLLGEISSASVEQTSGITQVSQAVSQLDEVTQQNAALVEQSTAAAGSLNQQAQRLAELVRTFRLDHEAAPPRAPAFAPAPAAAVLAQRTLTQARAGSRAVPAQRVPAAPPAPAAVAANNQDEWTSF